MSEIIFLAIITAFILYKLFIIIGSTTYNHEVGDNAGNGVRREKKVKAEVLPDDSQSTSYKHLQSKVAKVQLLDREFTIDHFLAGAQHAFRMLFQAMSDKNLYDLRHLTTGQLYHKICAKLDTDITQYEGYIAKIEKIDDMHINDIDIHGNLVNMFITVSYSGYLNNGVQCGDYKMNCVLTKHMSVDQLWKFTTLQHTHS